MAEIIETNEVLEDVMQELPTRKNPFCVISKATYGEYAVHDIQTNSSWGANPYGEDYAVVPDDMVEGIMETRGFCDIELNEDETEVGSFTARGIPEIPEPEAEPTTEERVTALEEQLAETDEVAIELYEAQAEQEAINAAQDEALIEIYEMMEG